jgi:phage shock protein E
MNKILMLLVILCSFSVQAESTYWIDVRTAAEYSEGHVEGVINIPYDEIGEKITALTQDKNAKIHLYCRSGNRSGKALVVLQEMHYVNAHNDGAISDLKHKAVVE